MIENQLQIMLIRDVTYKPIHDLIDAGENRWYHSSFSHFFKWRRFLHQRKEDQLKCSKNTSKDKAPTHQPIDNILRCPLTTLSFPRCCIDLYYQFIRYYCLCYDTQCKQNDTANLKCLYGQGFKREQLVKGKETHFSVQFMKNVPTMGSCSNSCIIK